MVPEGWLLVTLDKLCDKISVGLAISVTPFVRPSGIKLIRNQNIKRNYFNTDSVIYIDEEFAKKNKSKKVLEGDVVAVSTGSNIGEACVVPKEFEGALTFTTLITRPKKKHLDPQYLSLHINSEKGIYEVNRLMAGGGKPNLNSGELKRYKILKPPFPEQQKIAKILSTWDRAIETTEKLIENSKAQKKALMQQLLTGKKRIPGFDGEWNPYSLGTLGSTYAGLTGKTKEDFGKGSDFIPYINIFNNSRIDINELQAVTVSETEKQNKVSYGDIFFTTSSETPDEVGMSSVLLDDISVTYLNSFCFGYRLHSHKEFVPEYARHLFRGQSFRRCMYKLAQGATRYNLSKKESLKIRILLPSVFEQQKIASVLRVAEDEIETLQQKHACLIQEKKALMQQLLTGKRRVKV